MRAKTHTGDFGFTAERFFSVGRFAALQRSGNMIAMTRPRSPSSSRRRLLLGASQLLTAAWPALANAQRTVDLQLVLAVDASGSVDDVRFELQKQGYADAFRHPRVMAAITSGPGRAIACTMMQWTGPGMQVHAVPWTLLDGEAAALAFAEAIEAAPRQLFGGGTSISGAIDQGVRLLAASPFRAARRIIDVSGDGSNNRGRPVTEARDQAVARDVRINGLPILALEPRLDAYYRDFVIGGPGSFMIAAESYETFAAAILNKLILEIAWTPAAPRDFMRA